MIRSKKRIISISFLFVWIVFEFIQITVDNPFAYGMRLLDVFYNEMEKNKDRISFVKSYQEIEDNMKMERCQRF